MNHRPPPTEEESVWIAEKFLDVAMTAAHEGPDQGIAMVEEFFDCEPREATFRLWSWAAVGAVIASAAIGKLNPRPPADDEMWAIEHLPGSSEKNVEPDALAAMQCVVAHLNGDAPAAHDVISARWAVARYDGLFGLVCELIVLCAFLVKEGAFE